MSNTNHSINKPLSVYLHIPFCERKCRYCDFLSFKQSEEVIDRYVRALISEIEIRARELSSGSTRGRDVDTIFFGGGTPSLLTPAQIADIMQAIHANFQIVNSENSQKNGLPEISMELNPGTADPEKLRGFREAGINRLSIGMQSLQDRELELLGRIHNAAQAKKIFFDARSAGFENINIDLMSAIPAQTMKSYEKTLREVCEWSPEHISAYSLIIEPGTPLAQTDPCELEKLLPSEDEEREMYHFTSSFLKQHGYERYEISNYAKSGSESRHNSGYWTGHEYLGLGLGASSMYNNTRYRNISDLKTYMENCLSRSEKKIIEEEISLSETDRMEEFMFLGLRMMRGVREDKFLKQFGRTIDEVYGEQIKRHLSLGTILRADGRIYLTERGIDVSNSVMADFLF